MSNTADSAATGSLRTDAERRRSRARDEGWVDGLVIGVVSVLLTILVLLSGRHVRRH